jgi:hypothetical protein
MNLMTINTISCLFLFPAIILDLKMSNRLNHAAAVFNATTISNVTSGNAEYYSRIADFDKAPMVADMSSSGTPQASPTSDLVPILPKVTNISNYKYL